MIGGYTRGITRLVARCHQAVSRRGRATASTGTVLCSGTHNGHKYTIREAGHADYDEVMNIDDNVYRGLDYLPSNYHFNILDPRANGFIGVVDRRVVEYTCFWRLCGEMTMATSGRLHHDYRSSGLHTVMLKEMRQYLKEQHPELVYSWTSSAATERVIQNAKTELNETLEDTWHGVYGAIDASCIQTCGYPDHKVSILEPADIRAILNDPEALRSLYPGGYMVCADKWMLHPSKPDVIAAAVRTCDVIASGSVHDGDLAVSTVCFRRVPIGVALYVCYHGPCDETLLQSHIQTAAKMYSNIPNYLTAYKSSNSSERCPVAALGLYFPRGIKRQKIVDYVEKKFKAIVWDDVYAVAGLFKSYY